MCSSLFVQVALIAATHSYISGDVVFFAFIFFLNVLRKLDQPTFSSTVLPQLCLLVSMAASIL